MKANYYCLLVLAIVTINAASQPASYDLSRNVIASGGNNSAGTVNASNYSVEGTIGQSLAGTTSVSSPQFAVRAGFWAFEDLAPTAAGVSVSGRVTTAAGMPISGVRVSLTGTDSARVALTNPFGYYRFDEIEVGHTYLIEAIAKRFEFIPRTVSVSDELLDVDLVALP